MGQLHYIVCGRHAERACLGSDSSLRDLGPAPPFALPVDFGKEWLVRAMAADAGVTPERAAALSRRAALLGAFERRHRGCGLYSWSDDDDEQPIRLARQEAGWGTEKGLALEQEFDLARDDPLADKDPGATPGPGRVDMVRDINRRPLKEPTPIQWTRSKKPKQPRPVNRR